LDLWSDDRRAGVAARCLGGLYPDALLAQVLMASTYPLEWWEAARWSRDNPNVKGEAVADAVQTQTWDPA